MNMRSLRSFVFLGLLGLICYGFPSAAAAGEVDVLVNKLVEKGLLTPMEAQIIVDESAQHVAKEIAEGKSATLPAWVQNMKLKGDLRVRYQYERKSSNTDARERGRLRYRLGIETKVVENVKAAAGFASGGPDPRSTNQTFEDSFAHGDLRLDYAYAEWTPVKEAKIALGKFDAKNYIWAPTDMLWDTDIRPAGGSINYERNITGDIDGFANTGVWVMDENANSDRPAPFLTFLQSGVKWGNEKVDAKFACNYYNFHGAQGRALDWCRGTNTGITKTNNDGGCSGGLTYDYNAAGFSTELGAAKLFGGLSLNVDERIAVFMDFIHNTDANDNTNGWTTGMRFGNAKLKEKGQWQASYMFTRLEKDAWLDVLPDSDRKGGDTNIRGHELLLEYGLNKNVTLGIDYYQTARLTGTKDPERLIQLDTVFKF